MDKHNCVEVLDDGITPCDASWLLKIRRTKVHNARGTWAHLWYPAVELGKTAPLILYYDVPGSAVSRTVADVRQRRGRFVSL